MKQRFEKTGCEMVQPMMQFSVTQMHAGGVVHLQFAEKAPDHIHWQLNHVDLFVTATRARNLANALLSLAKAIEADGPSKPN